MTLRLPSESDPFVPLRLMYSNAPPSSLMGTALPKRLLIAWMPESSQRSTELLILICEVPERRP